MSNRKTKLGTLVRTNRAEAKARLLEILERNGGNLVWASEQTGFGRMTLRRWIDHLRLWGRVDEIRKKWTGAKRRSPN